MASEKTPTPTPTPSPTPTEKPTPKPTPTEKPTPTPTPEIKKKATETKKVVNTPTPTAKPALPVTPKPVLTPPSNPGAVKTTGPALEPPKPGHNIGKSGGIGRIGVPGAPPGPGVPWGKPGVIEEGSFPDDYLALIVAALQKNFVLPPHIRENKTCTVRFKIMQDGRLVEPQVVEGQGTGLPGLDQIAVKSVLDAGRVPPYPPDYSKAPFVYARVNFVFEPARQNP